MKRLLLLLMIVGTVHVASAQMADLKNIFERYASNEGCTSVSISSSMFRLFSTVSENSQDKDMKEFNRISNQITGLNILTCPEKAGNGLADRLYNDLQAKLPKSTYESLMTIRDADEKVDFLARKEGDMIKELVMLTRGDEEVTVILLTGTISLKDLSDFSKNMSIDGMEKLEDLENEE